MLLRKDVKKNIINLQRLILDKKENWLLKELLKVKLEINSWPKWKRIAFRVEEYSDSQKERDCAIKINKSPY